MVDGSRPRVVSAGLGDAAQLLQQKEGQGCWRVGSSLSKGGGGRVLACTGVGAEVLRENQTGKTKRGAQVNIQ